MNLHFNDSNLLLSYIQIYLKNSYNPDVIVNGTYYDTNNINLNILPYKYGLAHYIAKYLDSKFPRCVYNGDSEKFEDVEYKTVSIKDYFLSDNKGNSLTRPENDGEENKDNIYLSIYRIIKENNMCKGYLGDDSYDKPLGKDADDLPQGILTWDINKEICEIDNLVMSYLLNRTITPKSSRDDIYYMQQLLIHEDIDIMYRGIWNSDAYNMTDIIMEYQYKHIYDPQPLFVTGYFDIFTEASCLRDIGDNKYGIQGL